MVTPPVGLTNLSSRARHADSAIGVEMPLSPLDTATSYTVNCQALDPAAVYLVVVHETNPARLGGSADRWQGSRATQLHIEVVLVHPRRAVEPGVHTLEFLSATHLARTSHDLSLDEAIQMLVL
jgi:hypothetical protein